MIVHTIEREAVRGLIAGCGGAEWIWRLPTVGFAHPVPDHGWLPRGAGGDRRDQREEEADHRADRAGEPVQHQPALRADR